METGELIIVTMVTILSIFATISMVLKKKQNVKNSILKI